MKAASKSGGMGIIMRKGTWLIRTSFATATALMLTSVPGSTSYASTNDFIQSGNVRDALGMDTQFDTSKDIHSATGADIASDVVTNSSTGVVGNVTTESAVVLSGSVAVYGSAIATGAAITTGGAASMAAVTTGAAVSTGTAVNATKSAVAEKKSKNWYDKLAISTSKDYVYIRKAPSTKGKKLGKLYKGSVGTVIGKKGDWIKLSSGNITGYVSKKYVATGEKVKSAAQKYGTKTASLKAGTITLNVREKKSTKADIVTQIPEDKKYTVTGENAKWLKIKVGNKKGYVSKEYVNTRYYFKKAVSIQAEKAKKVRKAAAKESNKREDIISYALKFVGNRYVWGGTSLTNGTDCSGFTMRIYEKFGYSLPRTSAAQSGVGKSVKLSELQPGDLVFYKHGGRVHHVAMYIGGGRIVHAAGKKWGIITSNMNYNKVASARRIL